MLLLLLIGQANVRAADIAPTTSGPEALAKRYEAGRILYQSGHYIKAFSIFKELAEQGVPQAKMSLAYQYEKGQGVFPNPRQALYWYQSAADDGMIAAIIDLGLKYREGKLVRRNPVLAYALFLVVDRLSPGQASTALVKAVEEGLTKEQKRLGRQLAARMKPGQGAISRTIEQAQKIGSPVL